MPRRIKEVFMNKTIIVIALVIFVSLNFISCSTGGGVEVPTKIVSHESNFNHSITEYYETTDQTILIGKTKNEEEEMVEVWRKIINKGENQQAESEMYYRYGQLISKKEFDYAETAHSSRNGQPLQCIECYDGTNHLSE